MLVQISIFPTQCLFRLLDHTNHFCHAIQPMMVEMIGRRRKFEVQTHDSAKFLFIFFLRKHSMLTHNLARLNRVRFHERN